MHFHSRKHLLETLQLAYSTHSINHHGFIDNEGEALFTAIA
jgi:hypothetical protein